RKLGVAGAGDPARFQELLSALRQVPLHVKWIDRWRQIMADRRATFRLPETLDDDEAIRIGIHAFRRPWDNDVDSLIRDEVSASRWPSGMEPLDSVIDLWSSVERARLIQQGNERPAIALYSDTYTVYRVAEAAHRAKLLPQEKSVREIEAAIRNANASAHYGPGAECRPQAGGAAAFIADQGLRSRRLAEYAAADRDFALAAAGFCLLVLAAFLLAGSRRRDRALSAGLRPLFPLSGSVKVVLLGVLLPAAWWWAVVHLTPAGCRDLGIGYYNFYRIRSFPWLFSNVCGLLLILQAITVAASAELSRRAGFLGLGEARPGIRWLRRFMLLFTALLPLSMWLLETRPSWYWEILILAAACISLPLLWLLWTLGLGLLQLRLSPVFRALALRGFRTPLAVLCLLLLASIPWLRHREKELLKADLFTASGPEAGRFDAIYADRWVQQIRENLSPP
ncbi:MAG: hypothetical protein JWO82_3185, partial [Akkermansiaceae bacterium]|nr:hypothetical protein [Akkermansiaceae bacterium]